MIENTNNSVTELVSQIPAEDIKGLILTVSGRQVLLDSDVARLYGYETKAINQAATRNSKRFPPEFRFQLTQDDMDAILRSQFVTANGEDAISYLRSQIVTANKKARFLPYAYSEQGIGMLAGILKSDTAVQVSIGIMNAFVEMRRIISANRYIFERISNLDERLLEQDGKLQLQGAKIDEVLELLSAPETDKQWIFYKGQFYDAFKLVIELIRRAKSSITVVDNYIDNSILEMLENKHSGVSVTIITTKISRLSQQHLQKFAAQHGAVTVVESKDFHDRFIVIDETEVYALGASIKDLGNKCFEISKNKDTRQFISYVKSIVASANTATF